MASARFCGLSPLLFSCKHYKFEGKKILDMVKGSYQHKNEKKVKGVKIVKPSGHPRNLKLMANLKKKIMQFRDIIDLPPSDGSKSLGQLMIRTIKDLQNMYPEISPTIQVSEMKGASMDQILANFYKTLKLIEDSWTMNQDADIFDCDIQVNVENINPDQRVENILGTLDSLMKLTENFDMMDDEDEKKSLGPQSNTFGKMLESYSDSCSNSFCASPATPTSVLPDLMKAANAFYASPLLMSLRVQAVGKLNPIDVKRLSFHMLPHAGIQDPSNSCQKNSIIEEKVQDENSASQVKKADPLEEVKDNCTKIQMPTDSSTTQTEVLSLSSSQPDYSPNVASVQPTPTENNASEVKKADALEEVKDNCTKIQTPTNSSATQTEVLSLSSSQPDYSPNVASVQPTPPENSASEVKKVDPLEEVKDNCTKIQTPTDSSTTQTEVLSLSSSQPDYSPNVASVQPTPTNSASEVKKADPLEEVKDNCTEIQTPTDSSTTQTEVLSLSSSQTDYSPNVASVQPTQPPMPALHTIISASPMPTPPPPPPLLQPNVTTARPMAPLPPPPPPPQMSGAAPATPPPPPPPPGMSEAAPSPPPPMMPLKGSAMLSPPPLPLASGAAPPPPPALGAGRSLCHKKATKLKRSSQLGNLYRLLKGRLEGTELSKLPSVRKSKGAAAPTGGKQGMADALAEMTKRSAYFQQIEEDVEKHAKSITELKCSISTFQTKDMAELLKFHKQVESILEKLTDESQVLARFEGFPSKKLEALRMAAALYSKLDAMSTELQNWKILAPLGQLLDKVERYFNKIKGDIEALERIKDEESKKFQSQNIHFDFNILVKIKELMVDVSSNCMELALKENREAKVAATSGTKAEGQKKESVKILWRAFQFAFRVYTFAGGHDDRADKLTRELAKEIEANPDQQ